MHTIKPVTLLERDFSTDVLMWIFKKLLKALCRTPPVSVLISGQPS